MLVIRHGTQDELQRGCELLLPEKLSLGHHSLGGIKQLESYKETTAGQLSIKSSTSSKLLILLLWLYKTKLINPSRQYIRSKC